MAHWYEDHDEWIEQLREFLTEYGHEVDEDMLMFLSNIAVKVAKGEISMAEARHLLDKEMLKRMGYANLPDQDMFDAEVDFAGLVDVSEAVKDNLIRCGQPGISDACIQIWAHPELIDTEGTVTADPDKAGDTCIAVQSKRWFQIGGMNPEEHRLFHWAITQALRDYVATN